LHLALAREVTRLDGAVGFEPSARAMFSEVAINDLGRFAATARGRDLSSG